jgi:hypothetical protein
VGVQGRGIRSGNAEHPAFVWTSGPAPGRRSMRRSRRGPGPQAHNVGSFAVLRASGAATIDRTRRQQSRRLSGGDHPGPALSPPPLRVAPPPVLVAVAKGAPARGRGEGERCPARPALARDFEPR